MKIYRFLALESIQRIGIILSLTIMFQIRQSIAQGLCGTDEYYAAQSKLHPEMVEAQHKMDAYIEALRTAQNKTSTKDIGQEITVPICFHIIHNNGPENISDQMVKNEVAQLNIDYNELNSDTSRVRAMFKPLIANPRITFQLATLDPYGRCTSGIDRIVSKLTDSATDQVKALDEWDSKHYLNIWVVKSILSLGLPPGEQVAGYSHFPWDATYDPADDGIVIGYSYIGKGKRVLTHEIGHYFGLYHPFQDGCSTDQNIEGDHIADTPPVATASFGWKPGTNSCHTDNPDLTDLIEDYMDYADLPCMFTTDQVWRIRAFAFERSELISQGNLDTLLYSCTSGIDNSKMSTNASVSIFPNPASGAVTLQIESGFIGKGSISLIDVTGKTIFVNENEIFVQGSQKLSFTAPQLHIQTGGVYFFRVIIGNNVIQKKVVFRD